MHRDGQPVGLERDAAARAVDAGEPEPAERRVHLPRVRERADRALAVAQRDEHALLPAVDRAGPRAGRGVDGQPERAHEVDPVHAALEQRAAAGQDRIVAPVAGALALERVDVEEEDVAERAALDDLAQVCERGLVRVVLGDEHPPARAPRRVARVIEVRGARERGLLDDDVLARLQRAHGPLEVQRGRREHERGVDARVGERRVIGFERTRAAVAACVLPRDARPPAREVAQRLVFEPPQRARVHACGEPAAEEGEAEGRAGGHGVSRPPVRAAAWVPRAARARRRSAILACAPAATSRVGVPPHEARVPSPPSARALRARRSAARAPRW